MEEENMRKKTSYIPKGKGYAYEYWYILRTAME